MASDTEQLAQLVNGIVPDEDRGGLIDDPITPQDDDVLSHSSQQTIPSTQAQSPIDPGASFQSDASDDRQTASIIPSSLTPPPSSQLPGNLGVGVGPVNNLAYGASHHSSIFSPPATGFNGLKREASGPTEFIPPSPRQIAEASADELRNMLHMCIAEHAKLKLDAAHHKLQYNLLSMQADEDAKRAAVEHEMTRREVEALRTAEHSRQARRDLDVATESHQAKYFKLQVMYEKRLEDLEAYDKRVKAAKKIIQQKEDHIISLTDERDLLLNRIRENREHFHILTSPGGIYYGAVTPKQSASTPVQHQATPRQTPRSAQREARQDRDHGKTNFAVLLQALNQENSSAPSTPITGHRTTSRNPSKHTRNVQSMSSLPTTPTGRARYDHGGLLPSIDLVPQTEPPYRNSRFIPETPTPSRREVRKSRESTISAEDNEELARQALQSVAAASFASRGSQISRGSRRQQAGDEEAEDVFESQASQVASEMLRRDPRESFEVASSMGNSRSGTPAPADKSAKLQAKLFGGLNKSGLAGGSDKRKFSGQHGDGRDDLSPRDGLTSPTKRLRVAGGLRDPGHVGLGIQYSQQA